jgi:hypothetical protein
MTLGPYPACPVGHDLIEVRDGLVIREHSQQLLDAIHVLLDVVLREFEVERPEHHVVEVFINVLSHVGLHKRVLQMDGGEV